MNVKSIMMNNKKGYIVGTIIYRNVYIDDKKLSPEPSQKLFNHSPDGFAWGYGGSGPAQLALAILFELTDKVFALKYYQDFKWDFIAGFNGDKDFFIKISTVKKWIDKKNENNTKN